jgi:hypothetical protein
VQRALRGRIVREREWQTRTTLPLARAGGIARRDCGHAGDVRGEGVGVNVDDTERAELIAALHQAATFGEALLDLNERLLDALTTGANRPDVEELEYLRAGLSRWREQLATLRQRIAGLAIIPPEQTQ